MGAKQPKGGPAPGGGPVPAPRRRQLSRDRGDFLTSLMVRSGEKFAKAAGDRQPPYHRRIGMIQELLVLAKQGRQEEATDLLKHLRQVSGRRRERTPGLGGCTPASWVRPGPSDVCVLAGWRPGLQVRVDPQALGRGSVVATRLLFPEPPFEGYEADT